MAVTFMSEIAFGTSAAICLLVVASVLSPVDAQQLPAPPLVDQITNGNWLPQAEAESLRDELYYQRAVHAYSPCCRR